MQSSRESVLQESLYYKPSQKQVTKLLVDIQGKAHEIKNYRELLLQKQDFQKNNQILTGGFQKINQILDPKINRTSLQDSDFNAFNDLGGTCPICYEQIKGKSLNCTICKNIVCRNCLVRNRWMKNGFMAKFCQKCDQAFLQALLNKEFLKEIALYQKGFETLVREQESLEMLLNSQKMKVKKEKISEQRKLMFQNEEKIQQLKYEKQTQKEKIQEVKNKIDWGESINKGLRVKYRKLKKLLKQSFGSSNSDSAYVEWEPPKAEDDIDLDDDGINRSFITTNFDKSPELEEVEGVHDKQFCKCQLI